MCQLPRPNCRIKTWPWRPLTPTRARHWTRYSKTCFKFWSRLTIMTSMTIISSLLISKMQSRMALVRITQMQLSARNYTTVGRARTHLYVQCPLSQTCRQMRRHSRQKRTTTSWLPNSFTSIRATELSTSLNRATSSSIWTIRVRSLLLVGCSTCWPNPTFLRADPATSLLSIRTNLKLQKKVSVVSLKRGRP